MSSPLVRRRVSRVLLWLLLLTGTPSLTAREVFGSWSTQEKAEEAILFMQRVKKEFTERANRLSQEGGKPVDVTMPFVDSMDSQDAKVAAEWEKFRSGKMGEANTARWTGKGLKELEGVRKKLAAAEKPATADWDKKNKDGKKKVELPPEAEAFIYEMSVKARNLGVILDNSPSMTKALPIVREEIKRRFSGARFLEVDSSRLKMPSPKWGLYGEWYYCTMLEERNPFDPKWFLPAIPQEEIHYHMIQYKRDTFAAMRSLISLMEVDAVYWFCDFEDEIEPAAVRALGDLLKKNGVRLYIHSVKNSPPGAVMNLVRESNGKTTKAVPGAAPAAGSPATPAPAATPAGEASAITWDFLKANLNKTVRIRGTIANQWISENNGFMGLSIAPAQESALSIEFPAKSFKPTTSRAGLMDQFPKGSIFEATGILQEGPDHGSTGRRGIILKLSALSDFKFLPDGTPLPVAKPAEGPAKPQTVEVDPARYKAIKLIPREYKANFDQLVMVTGKVKSLQSAPADGRATMTLEGTNLILHYNGKELAGVLPSTVAVGTTVTAYGKLFDVQERPPVLRLDAVKVTPAAGP